ncbi:hypothetical protein CWB98_17510 [Pseudoalteromonas rubra]|uniref:Uncharacterized protein n=1 Tax=Pseudoalteromonas rubra TaxID=43658 RepID=A0A5S3WW54_9GAMM|nr:hypothetical protein CWB98_17510 [Pseudoalteromonas rubra]
MHVVEMVLSSVLIIGLVLAWRDYNARWLFILLGLFQVLEATTKPITIQWTLHYYLWCAVLSVILLAMILFRGLIAEKVYNFTKIEYFKRTRESYALTIPECAFCFLIFVSSVFCLLAWLEILLYYYKIVSYPVIYHHLWVPTLYTLHILEALALITFITRIIRPKGALNYEKN